MAVPTTVAELIEQTWPDAQEVHDLEQYLDRWLEKHGGNYPPAKEHNFIATGAMLRKAAAAPKHRRRRKPARPTHVGTDRVQLQLPI